MGFKFKEIGMKGLFEIIPQIYGDVRGGFFEAYNEKDFFVAGITERFVQDNQSFSIKGVLRGLHFQKRHPQGKIIRVLKGKVFDVAVDLRENSPTFGKWQGLVLDSERQNQLYIPKGFAHGFFVLSDEAVSSYKCSDFYHPEDEGGLMWNDPLIGVDWFGAAQGVEPLLSEKDKTHPLFNPGAKYFNADASAWLGN